MGAGVAPYPIDSLRNDVCQGLPELLLPCSAINWIVCHNRHHTSNPYWLHLEEMPVDTGWVTPEPILYVYKRCKRVANRNGPLLQLGCMCRQAQDATGLHVPSGTDATRVACTMQVGYMCRQAQNNSESIPGVAYVLELVGQDDYGPWADTSGLKPGECCTLHGSPPPLSLIRRI